MTNFNINTERMINHFCEMVKIKSVTFEEANMCDYLVKYLTEMGADEVYYDKCLYSIGKEGGNVMAYFKGNMEGEPICLNAHIDTVAHEGNIEPVVRDGYVYSAGDTILGADDKAGIASIIEAYKAVKDMGLPIKDVYMYFTANEEMGMYGAKLFDYSKLKCKEIISVDAAGDPGVIAAAGRGSNIIEITFKGKQAHIIRNPEEGINALKMMAEAIANIPVGKFEDETTINIHGVNAEVGMTSFIPGEAKLLANVRAFDIPTTDKMTNDIIDICKAAAEKFGGDIEVKTDLTLPPLWLDKDTSLYSRMIQYYRDMGIEPWDFTLPGAGDGNHFCYKGYDCIIIACGMTKVHTFEEQVGIKQLETTANLMARFMTEN